jgi:hypothetical protein
MGKDGAENKKIKFKINKVMFTDLIVKELYLRDTCKQPVEPQCSAEHSLKSTALRSESWKFRRCLWTAVLISGNMSVPQTLQHPVIER